MSSRDHRLRYHPIPTTTTVTDTSTTTNTASNHDAIPYDVGDIVRVKDRVPTEPSVALVVQKRLASARIAGIDGTDTTVADRHPTYPADDPVVRVVYTEALDEHAPDWRDEWPTDEATQRGDGIHGDIVRYISRNTVPLERYDYPVSRLESCNDHDHGAVSRHDGYSESHE